MEHSAEYAGHTYSWAGDLYLDTVLTREDGQEVRYSSLSTMSNGRADAAFPEARGFAQ